MKKGLQIILCLFYFYSVNGQHGLNNSADASVASGKTSRYASITRAGSNIDIIYQRCYWRINPDSTAKGIKGSVMTRFTTIINNVNAISFDMHSVLIIDSISFRNARVPVANISRTGNVVNILLGVNLVRNITDSIKIFYRGTPPNAAGSSIGYIKSSTASAGNFIYTVSQPYEDKDWWPCKADLTDKIDSIDIYINTPTGFRAASNGVLISSTASAGSVTHFWKHRYPIPSYLVCVGVAKYTVLNSGTVNIGGTNMPVFHYVFARTSYTALQGTLDLCKPMLNSFSNLLGDYPYKNEKYGHYEHQSNAGGMEHATFSGMSAGAMSDWKVIAHELGHQWFGDKVTCGSWNHIWLNEGFAQFMETLAAETVPSLNANLPSIRSTIKTGARNINTLSPYLSNVSTTNDIFGSNTGRYYQRGAMIVSMLRALMGDQKFFAGLRNYLNDPLLAYRTALTDDLRLHLESASGMSLSQFFNDWVYGSGNPNYSVQWNTNNKRIYISMVQTRSAGASVSYFNMPVVLKFSSVSKDTTVIIYDQGGSLSYAGGTFSPSAATGTISYDLSFTPTAVSFDPSNVTMATGITGIMATLDVAIQDFAVTKIGQDRKLDLLLTDHRSVVKVLLQKSLNGENFTDAAEMYMRNNFQNQFTCIDPATASTKIFYRAKCIAPDASVKYSKVIYCAGEEKLRLLLSPNPASNQLLIQNWPESWPTEVKVQIFNLQGANTWSSNMQVTNKSMLLKLRKMPAGMYVIQASSMQNELLMNERFLVGSQL